MLKYIFFGSDNPIDLLIIPFTNNICKFYNFQRGQIFSEASKIIILTNELKVSAAGATYFFGVIELLLLQLL